MQVRGNFNFQARDEDEISFQEGDIMTIVDSKEDPLWYKVSLRGKQGFVPRNYVSPVTKSSRWDERAVTDNTPTVAVFKASGNSQYAEPVKAPSGDQEETSASSREYKKPKTSYCDDRPKTSYDKVKNLLSNRLTAAPKAKSKPSDARPITKEQIEGAALKGPWQSPMTKTPAAATGSNAIPLVTTSVMPDLAGSRLLQYQQMLNPTVTATPTGFMGGTQHQFRAARPALYGYGQRPMGPPRPRGIRPKKDYPTPAFITSEGQSYQPQMPTPAAPPAVAAVGKVNENSQSYCPSQSQQNMVQYIKSQPIGHRVPDKNDQPSYLCDVCKVYCTGADTFASHLAGKAHQKQVERQAILATGGASGAVIDSNELRTLGQAPQQYFCDLCDISVSGTVNYDNHLTGKQHAKKKLQKANTITPILPQPVAAPTAIPLPVGQPPAIPATGARLPRPILPAATSSTYADQADKLINAHQPQQSGTVYGQYTCEICNITCCGIQPYQAHMAGKKHKAKEQTQLRMAQGKRIQNEIYCPYCNISCIGNDPYIAHLAGSQHIKNEDKRRMFLIDSLKTCTDTEEKTKLQRELDMLLQRKAERGKLADRQAQPNLPDTEPLADCLNNSDDMEMDESVVEASTSAVPPPSIISDEQFALAMSSLKRNSSTDVGTNKKVCH